MIQIFLKVQKSRYRFDTYSTPRTALTMSPVLWCVCVCVAIFAKQRHTIMLLRHCGARLYATYGSGNHRRHIRRPHIVLRVGLFATIFIKFRNGLC